MTFFVFIGFGLLLLRIERSEQGLLGNFWVSSKFEFVHIFWIWFVVFGLSGRIMYVYSFDIWKTNYSFVKKYMFCLYFNSKIVGFKVSLVVFEFLLFGLFFCVIFIMSYYFVLFFSVLFWHVLFGHGTI